MAQVKAFPLHDLLRKVPPLFDEDGMVVYLAAQNPDVEARRSSISLSDCSGRPLSSVHSWKGDTTEPRVELGPYSEDLRTWLLGQRAFPKHVYLIVVVEKPEKAQITMIDPYESVRQGYRAHFAHVPGILFMLALRKTVDESTRTLSITNTESPVNVSEGSAEL